LSFFHEQPEDEDKYGTNTVAGILKYSDKNLSQCNSVHNKSNHLSLGMASEIEAGRDT
jgi:hypothetical protein